MEWDGGIVAVIGQREQSDGVGELHRQPLEDEGAGL